MYRQHPHRFLDIGDKHININRLNSNKISLYTSGGTSPIYQYQIITDKLKRLIKYLIKCEFDSIDQEDIDLLDDYERDVFRIVLEKCNIKNEFDLDNINIRNRDKLISKFNIMKGEILNGNDSQELLKEFGEVLDQLRDIKLLEKHEYNKLKKLLK